MIPSVPTFVLGNGSVIPYLRQRRERVQRLLGYSTLLLQQRLVLDDVRAGLEAECLRDISARKRIWRYVAQKEKGKGMTQGIRCYHPGATERPDLRNEDRRDDYPTHWYCPDCDTYFPLIGDTDHWIIYRTLDQEIVSDSKTLPPKT